MKIRAKHLILGFSVPFVLYAILGGFLGRALARDSAYRYLSVFQDVVTLIMNNYLKAPEMEIVMDGAIRGMMEALDPDSCYLTPEQFEAFTDPDKEPQADIGVEVTKGYYLQVVSVLPGSPAHKAGLEAGDLIKSVDGVNTRETNVIVGESMLHGPAGSTVELEVIRGRETKPTSFTIHRRNVAVSPVEFRMLDEDTGYIHVASFRAGTDRDVKRGIEMLKRDGAQEIVLDVRNSFGRLAEEGARVAELFISGGTAAELVSRKGETTELSLAADRVAWQGPTVLVINGASLGAAEILASAFATSQRAELVGVQTSGRAAVQKTIALGDGAGVVLSVAQYQTPEGESILGKGIAPTVELSRADRQATENDEDVLLDKALEVLSEQTKAKAAA